jgi:ribosomal protein L14
VRRGDIRHAVVVRAAKEIRRKDGSRIKFDDNACVLVNKSGEPIGTRLNGEFDVRTMKGRRANMIRGRCIGAEVERMVEDSVTCTGSCII